MSRAEAMTARMMAGRIEGSIIPALIPRWATIRATSLRATIPMPTTRDWWRLMRHIRPPRPQPATLDRTAAATSSRAKSRMLELICRRSVFMPTLAKNTGVNTM